MKKGITVILFLFYSYANSSLREKRLILHSSDDIFNEIQTLKSEIASIKASSDLEIASLKASSDANRKRKHRFLNIILF
jgi:hypothetical protein